MQNDTSLRDAPLANAQPTQTVQVVANIPLPPPRPVIEPVQSKVVPSVREIAQANKPAMLANAAAAPKPNKALTIFEKLFGKRDQPEKTQLAYASSDAGVTGSIPTNTNDVAAGMAPPYDRQTAVYDITARTVYLPDGTRLEAHSGLGDRLDDPRSMRERMRGVTPPHVYDLKLREAPFHGVEALRLNPVGGEGGDLRPQRASGAHLHARTERRFQRLRLVPRLQPFPAGLQEGRREAPGRCGEGGLRLLPLEP